MAFTKDQLVIFAARSGNLASLRERVSAGSNVNHLDPVHGAPLMAAIRAVNVPAVEWLIAHGADVNHEYGDNIGPLEIALHNPVPEVVGLLLQAGARLRKKARRYYAKRLTECLKLLARRKPGRSRVTKQSSSAGSRTATVREQPRKLADNQMQPTSSAMARRRGPRS